MVIETSDTKAKRHLLSSKHLGREVKIDFYAPPFSLVQGKDPHLLLINDGQDLITMEFESILERLYKNEIIEPVFCVGIHCSADRKQEYGTIGITDFNGRGSRAGRYEKFVLNELIPFIRKESGFTSFADLSYCGFSLGGLSALDLVWSHPELFSSVGVFSGSLWWRKVDQDDPDFNEETDRIMHQKIKSGRFVPHYRFFFETGTQDETADRNHNGIIDSIDDTISLIEELKKLGYPPQHIKYIEIRDGRHDVPTWGRAFPMFLEWAFHCK